MVVFVIAAAGILHLRFGDATNLPAQSGGVIGEFVGNAARKGLGTTGGPLILLTLGLFMMIVNGILVYYSLKLAPGGLTMTFQHSIVAGLILGLINYTVSTSYDMVYLKEMEKDSGY